MWLAGHTFANPCFRQCVWNDVFFKLEGFHPNVYERWFYNVRHVYKVGKGLFVPYQDTVQDKNTVQETRYLCFLEDVKEGEKHRVVVLLWHNVTTTWKPASCLASSGLQLHIVIGISVSEPWFFPACVRFFDHIPCHIIWHQSIFG